MLDETLCPRGRHSSPSPAEDNGLSAGTERLGLSGPHFFVSNPFNKTPRRVCTEKGHYDLIDLETLPDDYLPRTNYRPMADRAEYLATDAARQLGRGAARRCAKPVTAYYRYVHRTRRISSGKRTLTSSVHPPPGASRMFIPSFSTFRDDRHLFDAGVHALICRVISW